MALPGNDSLNLLKSLHQDLIRITDSQFANVDRLQTELESHVEELRSLLARAKKNDKSRTQLSSGSIRAAHVEEPLADTVLTGTFLLGEETVTVNDDFKQDAIQLADFLDLDEIEAANLYASALSDAASLDRPPLVTSIIIFHERRQYLVECLRLCFTVAAESFELEDEELKALFRSLINLVVRGDGSPSPDGSSFWQKTLSCMSDIEQWLQHLAERIQSVSLTGQSQSDAFMEIMDFQRSSLTRQHESLSAIAYHLTLNESIKVDDLLFLLKKMKTLERYDLVMTHYLPPLFSALSYFGPGYKGNSTSDEARSIHGVITSTKENESWTSRNLQAATASYWLAEYSARFVDHASPAETKADPDADPEIRSKILLDSLRDGAFQFMLAVAQDVKTGPWFDPLRKGLTAFLIQDAPAMHTEAFHSESFFQTILMAQLQDFVQAFVTNMPDTLRALRVDEDEHRRNMQSQLQRPSELPLHLERFFVIAAFAFEGSEHAAERFWTQTDGNLYGFLLWASQRQPTPRVATFCELLRALSYGETCADHAHRFLLEDKQSGTGRMRRNSPMSWHHITSELEFYSSTIRERPAVQSGKGPAEQIIVEPESEMMLECYLRLIAHLCQNSPAARDWLLTNQTFHLHEQLFLLCSSSIESRLRGNAFAALASLLTGKNREVGDGLWTALDAWIFGVNSMPASAQRQNHLQAAQISSEQAIFTSIATGFEEPNAFVGLLASLISPFPEDAVLNDSLPFPESLGAAYRMPGIEPYVDFVVGRALAQKSVELQDPLQIRILRANALSFITTCLTGFNEDLVAFANQSSIFVDAAMRTSSLATYAKIHPFARAMEWLFNDAVIDVLFDTADQDVKEVNGSTPDSPLMLGLLQSIRVINLALSMQSTYLDIVRPIVKLSHTPKRVAVANSALASFEDAILNNMSIVPKLGLYCGSGHQELAVVSLQLLQKLAGSRKLAASVPTSANGPGDKSRLVTAMERDGSHEAVAHSLASLMQFDDKILERGPEYSGFVIQLELLGFLNNCLATTPDRPNLAHSLLGFTCHPNRLEASPEGLFAQGISLFHAIVQYILCMPDGDEDTLVSWLLVAKVEATGILTGLLKSPLSSRLVLADLRMNEYFFAQWAKQTPIRNETMWDGKLLNAPDFYVADSGTAYLSFINQRNALLEYAALEIHAISVEGLASMKSRMLSTLQGTVSFLDGTQGPCVPLLGVLDFVDPELSDELPLPQTKYFNLHDIEICRTQLGAGAMYNVDAAAQLLSLRANEIRKTGQLQAPADELQLLADSENILFCLHLNNRKVDVRAAHTATLRSWTHLIAIVLEDVEFTTPAEKNAFIFQAMQVVLPRLEQSYSNDIGAAALYAQLARALLQHVDATPSPTDRSTTGDTTNEQLSQLFRIALAGIQDSTSSATLRLSCTQICHEYLRHIAATGNVSQRTFALQSIKTRGDLLLEVLCDEAYAGDETNRIAALLLLGSFVSASNSETSKSVVEALARINFISVLVTILKRMPQDFRERSDAIVTVYTVSLSLLLLICQTRPGAAYVVNAGLFTAIRESHLFNTDPDLGLEADNPSALQTYYTLLLHLVNVLVACLLSRGPENQQTITLVRRFCQEYRPLIVAVFKRSAGVGLMGERAVGGRGGLQETVGDLADSLMVLVGGCGWLDSEEEAGNRGGVQGGLFT